MPVPPEPGVPEPVRERIIALTAQVLPSVTPLPGTLRKVASFAPARRARVGATLLWEALAEDPFRASVATQVAVLNLPEDPPNEVAKAWLDKSPGWQELLAASTSVDDAGADARGTELAADLERLRAQLADARAALRTERAAWRERERELRGELSEVRRKLGDERAARREAVKALEEIQAVRSSDQAEQRSARSGAESEVRRLRAEVEDLRNQVGVLRRGAKSERQASQNRAWYLLDALVESASGLRRELGLPAPTAAPADEIEAALVGTEVPKAARAATVGMVENLLAVPRSRLIVDGYNVTKTAWPSATLEAQRSRLVAALSALAARTGAETTVVFDAGASGARPAVPTPRGLRVVFSPIGVIADDVIRQLVEAEPRGRMVLVVTNDREIVVDVTRNGARSVASELLIEMITAS